MGKRLVITPTMRAEMFNEAWDWCWANLPNRYNCSWVTATDLHRRVRARAVEMIQGLEFGAMGQDAWGIPLRLTGFDLEDCRRWLLDRVASGKLRADSPSGKRTTTGLRFRPAGLDLTPAEVETKHKKLRAAERGTIWHLATDSYGKPACARPPKANSLYFGHRRKPLFCTKDTIRITCRKCCKLIPVPTPVTT